MNQFPDWLYQFTPRDEQLTPIQIVGRDNTQVTNVATHTGTIFTVPIAFLFLLTHCNWNMSPDGAIVARNFELQWGEPDGGNVHLLIGQSALNGSGVGDGAAGIWRGHDAYIGALLPFGARVEWIARYSAAGVASHITDVSITGVLIPRGNVALG